MAQKQINLGTGYDTNDGSKLRDGGGITNDNFTETYARATTWRAGVYPQRTIVLDGNDTYILSTQAILPFNSLNFPNELANGDWILITNVYDDTWIQPAINEKVSFKGTWVSSEYNKYDQVYSAPYIGFSLEDNNTDPFPPVPESSGQWLVDVAPAWDTQTVTGDVATGMQFTLQNILQISDLRIWITTQADASYTIAVMKFERNAYVLLGSEDVAAGNPNGWYSIGLEEASVLMYPGELYRITVVTHVETGDVITPTNYVHQVGDVTVASGDISIVSGNAHISTTDDDGTPRGTLLADIKTNDVIAITETGDANRNITYRATGPSVLNGTQYDVPVIIASIGDDVRDNRDVTVDFEIGGAEVSTDYVREVGALTGFNNIAGFVTQNLDDLYSTSLVLDENLYGLDVYYIKYNTSPKWYYIPVGAGGGGSSEGTDIVIVDNLITQNANEALSANMGYVLNTDLQAHKTNQTNPHQTAVSNLSDYIGTPNANDRLAWDAETSKWSPKRSLSALGIFEFDYQFNTSTDASPPAGDIQRNNVDPALTTILYFNELDKSNSDLSDYWSRVKSGDWINMHDVGDVDRRENFDVVGAPTLTGDVWSIPVNFYEQVGTPFANNMNLKVLWNVDPGQETASFSEVITLGETVAVNDIIYLNSDGLWYKAIATDVTNLTSRLLCAVLGGNAGQTVTVYNVAAVRYTGAANMGGPVYLSTNVAGGFQTTVPGANATNNAKVIGYITVDDKNWFPGEDRYFYFFPNWDYVNSEGTIINGIPVMKGVPPDQIARFDQTNIFDQIQIYEASVYFRDTFQIQNAAGVTYGRFGDLDYNLNKLLHIYDNQESNGGIFIDTVRALLGKLDGVGIYIENATKIANLLGMTEAILNNAPNESLINKGWALASKTTGEPTGSQRMPNAVFIEDADYQAAVTADDLVDGTLYYIPE